MKLDDDDGDGDGGAGELEGTDFLGTLSLFGRPGLSAVSVALRVVAIPSAVVVLVVEDFDR